jgi:oligoribonuclease (3'-5' exoribonuclease)
MRKKVEIKKALRSMSDIYAWLDTETTGLDPHAPSYHRVIEIAVVLTDPELNELKSFETKVLLSAADFANASAEALTVNGYTPEEWKDAQPHSRELWGTIHEMLKGKTIAGQNTPFDSKFVAAEMQRFGLKPAWHRRAFDTTTLAQYVMRAFNVRDKRGQLTASLVPVYAALGGPKLPEHRAMADVRRAQYLYRIFKDQFDGWLMTKYGSTTPPRL